MSHCFAAIAVLVPPTSWLWLERPELNRKARSPFCYKAEKNAGNEKKKRSALIFVQFRMHRSLGCTVEVALACNKNTKIIWLNTSKSTDLVEYLEVKPSTNALLLLLSCFYDFCFKEIRSIPNIAFIVWMERDKTNGGLSKLWIFFIPFISFC